MKIRKFKIESLNKKQTHYPSLLVSQQGCGMSTCRCSPKNFITLSDGATGLTAELTDEEIKLIRKNLLNDEMTSMFVLNGKIKYKR